MLKQSVTYTNFNDDEVTEVLRFNISKSELLDEMEMRTKLEEMGDRFSGEERDLTPEEIREVLEVVKYFMRLSYGELSADGKKFRKKDPVTGVPLWDEFITTAAYDSYLMSLFENGGEKAIAFMINIIPKDLQSEVMAAAGVNAQGSAVTTDQIRQMVLDADARNEAAGTKPPQIKDNAELRELAPTAPVLEDKPDQDIDALLAQMPTESGPNAGKTPISKQQADFLKEKLNAVQYEHHMADKYIED